MSKDIVYIEIETAIRHQSWATMQVGVKSEQRIIVDFRSKKVMQTFETGTTTILFWSVDSIRDKFQIIRPTFPSPGTVNFFAKGQTASAVHLMPNINYNFNILLSLSPQLVTVTGNHDGYPSYNVSVERRSVYDYVQGHLGQLFGDSDVTVLRRSVPWKFYILKPVSF